MPTDETTVYVNRSNAEIVDMVGREYSPNLDDSSENDQKMQELNFDDNSFAQAMFQSSPMEKPSQTRAQQAQQAQKRQEVKREFVGELAIAYIEVLDMDQKTAVKVAHETMEQMIASGQPLVIPPELQ